MSILILFFINYRSYALVGKIKGFEIPRLVQNDFFSVVSG
jgi:hypothetical protein